MHVSTMKDGPHKNSLEQVGLKLRATLDATLDVIQGKEAIGRHIQCMGLDDITHPKESSRKFKCPSRL